MKQTAADEFAKATVDRLLEIAGKNEPQRFKGFFMGAIVSNVLGNLPDDYWEKFIKAEPCGQPSCDCHEIASFVIPALERIRQDWQENTSQHFSA